MHGEDLNGRRKKKLRTRVNYAAEVRVTNAKIIVVEICLDKISVITDKVSKHW